MKNSKKNERLLKQLRSQEALKDDSSAIANEFDCSKAAWEWRRVFQENSSLKHVDLSFC
jgi:hypothetical protein